MLRLRICSAVMGASVSPPSVSTHMPTLLSSVSPGSTSVCAVRTLPCGSVKRTVAG